MRKWKNAFNGNSALLLDTNTLVFAGVNSPRLSPRVRAILDNPDTTLFVSAVTAWEFTNLVMRGRFPKGITFDLVQSGLATTVLDFPAEAWRIAETLPDLHRDPVDRMLIGHAIAIGETIITSDAMMRNYPVKTLW
jgi:PIN domain nuclease of toxin-antitoxin system